MLKNNYSKKLLLSCALLFSLPTLAQTITELRGHNYEVHSVSFSNDGELLASGSGDHNVIIWDTKAKEEIFRIEEHKRTVYSVAFSKLQRNVLATSSSDGQLVLWNVKTRKMIKTLVEGDTTSNGILSLDFSPIRNLLAVSYMGGEIALWNTNTLKLERFTSAHPYGFAMSVKFSPNGKKIVTTGGIDNTVKLFNSNDLSIRAVFGAPNKGLLNNKSSFPSFIEFMQDDFMQNTYKGTIWDASFSPDGNTIASVNSAGTLTLWREGQTNPFKETRVNDYLAQSVEYSKDGSKIYVGVDGFNSEDGNFVKIINSSTGVIEKEIEAHDNRIRGMAISKDGKQLATASWDETVKLWKL